MKRKHEIPVTILCMVIALLLLSYSAFRAWKLSFTHDESYTYLYASRDSFMQIISNRTTEISANNHILNTLFMKLFDNTLGSAEIFLRLQSLIAHALYLVFTFLLLKQFRSAILLLAGFMILNANPYLLDFFSLARGYALSISFMLVSLYYFMRYMKEFSNRTLLYSMIAASLAVLSNFALLNYYAALLLIQQVVLYSKYRSIKTNLVKSRMALIIFGAMAIICYEPLRKLIKYKRFDFGGNDGIWADTVSSLTDTFLYHQAYSRELFPILRGGVLIFSTVAALALLYKIYRGQLQELHKNALLILSVLFLILFFNTIQHYLFGSPFIVERFALFITPLFLLLVIHTLHMLIERGRTYSISGLILLSLITGAMTYHFSRSANTSYTLNWDYDVATKQMLQDLEEEKSAEGKQKVKLGVSWLFEPSANFYRVTKNLHWLEKITRESVSAEYDYYYISESDRLLLPENKETIREYAAAKSRLMK